MQVVIALISVVVGAVLSAALQHFVWKRQRREDQAGETRQQRARTAERFRELASLLIESSLVFKSGWATTDQNQVATVTLIECHRLRRELLNAAAAVRDAFPNHHPRLWPLS